MLTINVMTKKLLANLRARIWQAAHPEKHLAHARKYRSVHPRSPEIVSFLSAKNRCTNPNYCHWKDYGGRGIQFLFTSFEQFFAELGARPEGTTLDRYPNNDGNYEPGNVRWATKSEQRRNQRPVAA
jgi:hypothetical protein